MLRSQLPLSNPFYPSQPPPENTAERKKWRVDVSVEGFSVVCRVCGCLAGGEQGGKCAGCGKFRYCNRYHQTIDWKARHKKECKKLDTEVHIVHQDVIKKLGVILFPQWEIIIDSDEGKIACSDDSSDDEDDDKSEEDQEQDIETIKSLNTDTTNLPADEISKYVGNETKMGKKYTQFKETTKLAPDQVIRYQRLGKPLWISDKEIPEAKDIPDCELCGAPRIFEFQIMPQMLNNLDLDSLSRESNLSADGIDWGVLSIYTCSRSCNEGSAYKQEFLWKQDIEN